VRVNWESPTSLQNFVSQLNMTCATHSKIALLGMMIFVGWLTACFFIPRIADIYGRKPVFLVSMIVHLFIIIGLFLSTNMTFTIVLMFFIGLCAVGRYNVAFLYALEFMTDEKQKKVGPLINACECSALVTGTILAATTKTSDSILYTAFGLNLLVILSTIFYLFESPRYLYANGYFNECRSVLFQIACQNKLEA
jgi:MFS family permease